MGTGKSQPVAPPLQGIKLWSYLRYPEFDPLRGDPRFQQIFTESRPPGPGRAS